MHYRFINRWLLLLFEMFTKAHTMFQQHDKGNADDTFSIRKKDFSSGKHCFHEMVGGQLTFYLLEHEDFSPLPPSIPSYTILSSIALPHISAKFSACKALYCCISLLLF